MISVTAFLPSMHSAASKKLMTPEWITQGIHKFTGTSGYYFIKFKGEFMDIKIVEPQDMARLDKIDYDLLITDGAVFLLFVDKAFGTRLFKEISDALKNVKELMGDANWDLLKRDGKYILEAFTHGDDSETPIFSKELQAPSVEFPKIGLCSSRDPDYADFIVCLGNEN